jgi:hypothetical protein
MVCRPQPCISLDAHTNVATRDGCVARLRGLVSGLRTPLHSGLTTAAPWFPRPVAVAVAVYRAYGTVGTATGHTVPRTYTLI